ncbi:hypothetical protein RB195_018526 [Necator americanus]|uniref:Uncharacterized protein n=1 Tax=Necator americanus TaxID=51031 RepID=A0ABR1CA56_NECAM
MDEMKNGDRSTVRQESPYSTEVEDLQDDCASCCPLWMRVLANDESLGKSVARYGDADVEVDDRCNAKDKVSNDNIRSIFDVVPITEKTKKMRLRWFSHVLMREENSVAKTALKFEVSGVRPRGMPRIRWLGRIKLDMIDGRLCFLQFSLLMQWVEPNGRQEA